MPKLPDAVVRLADVRRVIATAREYRGKYPALGMLAANVPESADGFDLPGTKRVKSEQAAEGAGTGPEPDDDGDGSGPGLDAALDVAPLDVPDGREADRPDQDGDAYRLVGHDDDDDPAGPLLSPAVAALVAAFDGDWTEAGAAFVLARRPDPAKRADRRAAADAAKDVMRERVEGLAEDVAAGRMSPAAFRAALRQEVKDVHISAAVASRGGDWSAMTAEDWGRVGGRIGRQYGYADQFVRDIAAGLGTDDALSAARIRQRAGLYADAASHSFEAQEVANVGVDPTALPAHPGDGSTDCRTRCRCTWTLRIISAGRGDFNARWTLGAAEHCRTCLARGRAWRSIKVRGGKLVGAMPSA